MNDNFDLVSKSSQNDNINFEQESKDRTIFESESKDSISFEPKSKDNIYIEPESNVNINFEPKSKDNFESESKIEYQQYITGKLFKNSDRYIFLSEGEGEEIHFARVRDRSRVVFWRRGVLLFLRDGTRALLCRGVGVVDGRQGA